MAKKSGKTFCKVCINWEIKRPEQCSNTLKTGPKGSTLYFCTRRCKERYQKNPEKFR